MTNLKEGQRIDVYEVVERQPFCYDNQIGNHAALVECDAEDFTIRLAAMSTDTEGFYEHEVKKCGYYLKVKSLKGGSNA